MLFLAVLTSNARPFEVWTYDDLRDQSDLIAVVELTSVSNTTARLPDCEIPDLYQGKTASLKLHTILKGTVGGSDQIVLNYFTAVEPILNSPVFLDLSVSDEFLYLVFLVDNGDGSFSPVTGNFDSAFSVKKIVFEFPDTILEDWKKLSIQSEKSDHQSRETPTNEAGQ